MKALLHFLLVILAVACAKNEVKKKIHPTIQYDRELKQQIFGIQSDQPSYSANNNALSDEEEEPIMLYKGGKILTGNINVNMIFYGTWSKMERGLIEIFLSNLHRSEWFRTLEGYVDNTGRNISGPISVKGVDFDDYSLGAQLDDEDIFTLISQRLDSGKFEYDSNAIYFVFTSKDINVTSGICRLYCGWHSYESWQGKQVIYSLVGHIARCPYSCAGRELIRNGAPNYNAGLDGFFNVLAHEFVESATNPFFESYETSYFWEIADMCAWDFGVPKQPFGRAPYNVEFGGRIWLLQKIWSLKQNKCVLSDE